MPYTPTWNNPYVQQPFQQYTQQVSMPSIAQPFSYQQATNGLVWVNGRDSALQYSLPANSTSPPLLDKNGKNFYVVSTDGTGAKSIEVYDYLEHVEEPTVNVNGVDFVSREEFDNFVARVGAALEVLDGSKGPAQQEPATTNANQAANGGTALNAPRGHVGPNIKLDSD